MEILPSSELCGKSDPAHAATAPRGVVAGGSCPVCTPSVSNLGAQSSDAACKVCAQVFARRNSMQAVCSPRCALKLVNDGKRAAKDDRRETKRRLEAIKPRSKWLAEAQQAFNAYIRARDAALPCVSCGRHHQGSWDAGHYLTVGARPELRFDERNVHRQCVPCNRHLHGNLVLFRMGLVARIGAEAVARLEGPHPPQKYTVDDLREIRDRYRRLAREMGT